MEQPPIPESYPEQEEKKETETLSFESQLVLAKALFEAVDKRENFVKAHGGDFDTFAESWANLEEPRAEYDALDEVAENARKEVDEKISDKKEFVKKLKESGEKELAERISSMFGVPGEKFFSRIFKKGR